MYEITSCTQRKRKAAEGGRGSIQRGGMTVAEVKKLLDKEKRTWEEFVEFMLGQTAGINENGEMDFYESDIDRFLKRLPVID